MFVGKVLGLFQLVLCSDNSVIITIVILFLVTVLFVFVSLNNNRISQGRKKKLLVKLEELRAFAYSNEPAIRRDAVIKLDNLLAKALQYYFNNTNLCGENLKLANKIFKKKEEYWSNSEIKCLKQAIF